MKASDYYDNILSFVPTEERNDDLDIAIMTLLETIENNTDIDDLGVLLVTDEQAEAIVANAVGVREIAHEQDSRKGHY